MTARSISIDTRRRNSSTTFTYMSIRDFKSMAKAASLPQLSELDCRWQIAFESCETREDMTGKRFAVYVVRVTYGIESWLIFRRYSDFIEFHENRVSRCGLFLSVVVARSSIIVRSSSTGFGKV